MLAAWLLLGLATLALPVGFATGFLRAEPVTDGDVALSVAAVAFVFPAVVEELLFRVLLIPRAEEGASRGARWVWGIVSLVLFVASHPLKAAHATPARYATFADPVFLLLATMLGLACTVAYLRTGSLWPPVVIHWLAVAGWLLLLGGHERLHP